MERILVSMDARHGYREALNRAVSLAGRIGANVYVLLVLADGKNVSQVELDRELEQSVRGYLELLRRDGHQCVHVELFLTQGHYEEEVIRFASQCNITLLVMERGDAEPAAAGRESLAIEKIRHRLRCRVELVTPKRSL